MPADGSWCHRASPYPQPTERPPVSLQQQSMEARIAALEQGARPRTLEKRVAALEAAVHNTTPVQAVEMVKAVQVAQDERIGDVEEAMRSKQAAHDELEIRIREVEEERVTTTPQMKKLLRRVTHLEASVKFGELRMDWMRERHQLLLQLLVRGLVACEENNVEPQQPQPELEHCAQQPAPPGAASTGAASAGGGSSGRSNRGGIVVPDGRPILGTPDLRAAHRGLCGAFCGFCGRSAHRGPCGAFCGFCGGSAASSGGGEA